MTTAEEQLPKDFDEELPTLGSTSRITFESYLERSAAYFAKVEEAGDVPWFSDPERLSALGITTTGVDARRQLWHRRYTRPEPPESITKKSLDQIRAKDRLENTYMKPRTSHPAGSVPTEREAA